MSFFFKKGRDMKAFYSNHESRILHIAGLVAIAVIFIGILGLVI
jgi:hypothetical protein